MTLTAHDTPIDSFDVAPDGRTVAYVSEGTLWIRTPEPDIATPILTADGISAPTFSADGLRIAYEMPDGIYVIDAAGGEPQQVLADYTQPQFAGESMLVRIADGDLALYSFTTSDVRRLGSYDRAKPLPDGRLLASGAPAQGMSDGIYMLDLAGSGSVLLFQTPSGLHIRDFAPLSNGSVRLVMERADGLPAPLQVFDVTPTGSAVSIPVVPYLSEASVSPDGGTLAGYASGAGTLAVYSIALASESVLLVPGRADDLTFPAFR
jgi:hypothetical protein